ncbi:hypothetical protein CLV35_2230 [Motilibacter peucedani]|uniref:Uncharacterized protein n=1 Tax=Motilibacter peucedani TaxID=598650 RepID=A0A420XNF9_9ACTN|nr:hypothetical protein [Motilibacter peucedani]RKS73741.1 hypothetical protein CLV35_2230 [Motilibacter peucedani]
MRYVFGAVGVAAAALAVVQAWSAVTGRDLLGGDRPRRPVVVRRQAALAVVVLAWLAWFALSLAVG